MKKQFTWMTLALLSTLPLSQLAHAASAVDLVFVVDESSSMGGEHTWLTTTVNTLESQLQANGVGTGVDSNRYALVGFGDLTTVAGHTHTVGSGIWGTASELSTATGSLETTGDVEDGWSGIDTALNLTFRPGVARNIILITDEDRDVYDAGLSYSGILASLTSQNFLLNAVVNYGFEDVDQFEALGIDSQGNAYLDDGFGGYYASTGGVPTTGFGTTEADYIDLALATGGAAWDLNLLRLGGFSAEAFTQAFVDIKTQEIALQEPPPTVPVPAVPALMLFGLAGWWQVRRKKVSC